MRVTWAWAAVMVASLAVPVGADEKPPAPAKGQPSPAASKPEAPAKRGERVSRVVQLKNKDLLDAFDKLLRQFRVNVMTSRELGAIALHGFPEDVAVAEETIRKFDMPPAMKSVPKNIAFTAHLLVGRQQATSGPPLPAELGPVVEQFRSVFAYKGYELLDTLAIRIADDRRGESTVDGLIRWPAGAAWPAKTQLRILNAKITAEDEKGRSIAIPKLTVKVELPIAVREEITYRTTAIETGLDIREGQKVVVGKAAFDGTNDALILVLKAEVEG